MSTFRSTDIEDLCGAIEALLEHLKPFIAHITDIDWEPKDGVLSLILQGIVRRQYDCLGAVATLVRSGSGAPITALYQLLRRPSSHGSQMRPIPALNRTPAGGRAPARRSPVSLLR